MPQASTSRLVVRRIRESSFGVIPGAGNPKEVRLTGESLDFSLQKERSREIRPDRQVRDLVVVNASSNGGYNIELSYNQYDDELEEVMQSTWSVYGTQGVGTSFSAAYAANTITASVAPTGSSAFTTLAQGQWFKNKHTGSANDGKWFKVHASTAPTSTVITLDAATPATVEGSSAGATISTSRLVNGTTERSVTIEKAFTDINQFFAYRGMAAASFESGFNSGQLVAGAFGFMGKDAVRNAATALPGAPTAALNFDVMSAVTGVGNILEGGAAITGTFIQNLTMSLNNALRNRGGIGNLGAVSIGSGTIACTGQLSVYLADGTLYDKFLNNTATSIDVRVQDGAGNGYVFTFPRVKYGDAKVNAGALDQDAMISMPWEAMMDPTIGKTVIIHRGGVAAV
jgi:hypothetical protein